MPSHLSRCQLPQRVGALGTPVIMAGSPVLAELPRVSRLILWRNWSGAQNCLPLAREAPKDLDELVRVIRQAFGRTRPVGSGHSFSALVSTDGTLFSFVYFNGLLSHDSATLQAKFGGGTLMSRMGTSLREIGQALVNMADTDYRTLTGATATSTHGIGVGFGSYSVQVRGLQLVTANGEVLECDAKRNVEVFDTAQVSLGALGVVTRVRLQDCVACRLREWQWIARTEELLEDVEKNMCENQHWEMLVVTYSGYALSTALNETDELKTPPLDPAKEGDNEFVGLIKGLNKYLSDFSETRRILLNSLHHSARFDERADDPHTVYANACNVRFNEMEYSVSAEHGPTCLREILALTRDKGLRIRFLIEYRYVKVNDISLSIFEDRDSCSIPAHQHYSMNHHNFFVTVESTFWKYVGRPHWGKLYDLDTYQLQGLYPRWKAFVEIRQVLDPRGRFPNTYFSSILGTT